jgi:hypothetical protein
VKTFGPLYVDTLKYPSTFKFFPIIDKGWTNETEEPYRKGKCLVFRLPYTITGLIVGIWGKPTNLNEEEALMAALFGHEVSLEEIELEHF